MEGPIASARQDLHPSDETLFMACRRGDASAWEALVLRYQRLIFAIPRRAGLGDDECADVFQAVFALLIAHLDRIHQPSRVKAWLVTTARRETWRVMRRKRAAQSLDDGDAADDQAGHRQIPDDAPLPQEVILRLEEQHSVRAAVGALDERCRRLLTLLFYCHEPPPYSEIAAALDMREGSIGPTRARCLEKLRRLLENWGC